MTDGTYKIADYLQEIIQTREHNNLAVVVNKVDLVSPEQLERLILLKQRFKDVHFVSCKNDSGINQLMDVLAHKVTDLCGDPNAELLFSNERHLAHLEKAIAHLEKVPETIKLDFALAASQLKQAAYQLECLTGRITNEDVLDIIFKDFCIGK